MFVPPLFVASQSTRVYGGEAFLSDAVIVFDQYYLKVLKTFGPRWCADTNLGYEINAIALGSLSISLKLQSQGAVMVTRRS